MCGIAGYLIFEGMESGSDRLKKMSRLIAHRGPDDEGFVMINRSKKGYRQFSSSDSPNKIRKRFPDIGSSHSGFRHDIAMAHRRFSIIDLSHFGHQPMSDIEGTLFITFNGEIFNYIELRDELQSRGVVFKTNSDTEVLLASYKEWGVDFVGKLTGFWAFAIYDGKRDILLFSRDRIGKKPIYYFKNNRYLVWGSEIKSLLSFIENSEIDVDRDTVYLYLLSGIRDYSHSTFWKNIKMMDNASVWIFKLSEREELKYRYWNIPKKRYHTDEAPLNESISVFRKNIEISLYERLRADVPIAFELSGGLDSSVLVALRARMSEEKFSVFTVKYDDKKIDESAYAKDLVGKYNNIKHHIINFQEEDLFLYLDEFNELMEEPFHEPVLLIGQLLRRRIAEVGYKVIIGGAGGDEIFGGYTEYAIPIIRALKKEKNYLKILKNILFYKEKYPLSFFPFLSLVFRKIFGIGYGSSFQNQYLNPHFHETLTRVISVVPKNAEELFLRNMEDLKMYYWMSSNDKSDMGIPVEVRNPFLDHRVVEHIFRLPVEYFFRNGWLKWFLRKSFSKELPESVLWRKRKQGFPFPIKKWIDSNSEKLKDIVSRGDNEYINRSMVLSEFDNIRMKDPYFLWRMINLELWKEKFDLFNRDYSEEGTEK